MTTLLKSRMSFQHVTDHLVFVRQRAVKPASPDEFELIAQVEMIKYLFGVISRFSGSEHHLLSGLV